MYAASGKWNAWSSSSWPSNFFASETATSSARSAAGPKSVGTSRR
jgi:hypothetical protein